PLPCSRARASTISAVSAPAGARPVSRFAYPCRATSKVCPAGQRRPAVTTSNGSRHSGQRSLLAGPPAPHPPPPVPPHRFPAPRLAPPPSPEQIRLAPKALLHDHLDGGVRPATIVEIAGEIGHELPANDAESLARWFEEQANSGSLERYLETFVHTVGVMQTP